MVSKKANFTIYHFVSFHEMLSCNLTLSHGLVFVQFSFLTYFLSVPNDISNDTMQRDVLVMVLRASVSVYCVVSQKANFIIYLLCISS